MIFLCWKIGVVGDGLQCENIKYQKQVNVGIGENSTNL
jgi:hypothetical protein